MKMFQYKYFCIDSFNTVTKKNALRKFIFRNESKMNGLPEFRQ